MGNRIYVGNLSFHTSSDTIRVAFEQYGTVSDVHLVMDRESGRPRGFGFVTMGTGEAAQAAWVMRRIASRSSGRGLFFTRRAAESEAWATYSC